MALHVFGSCSNWIICFFIVTLKVLCILDTNPVLDIWVLSIFFHFPSSFCKVFIVLYIAFKSMIHLELILFKTWDLKFNVYCLCMSNCSSTTWKSSISSIELFLQLCQKSDECICDHNFWARYSVPSIYVSFPLPVLQLWLL